MLLSTIFAIGSVATAEAAEKTPLDLCEEQVDFIEANFDKFITEYNANADEQIRSSAKYIEETIPTYLMDDGEYGIYIDFDGENGYAVMTKDKTFYEFETRGDLEYLKGVNETYYGKFDKFMYFDSQNGTYERYEYEANTTSLTQPDTTHDGQPTEGGDGKIFDIDAYVADAYPSYTYVGRKIIPDYQWVYQWDTSVYQSDEGSEGNCVINATYSMMNDWRRKGYYSQLPSGTTDYSTNIKNDRMYSKYGNGSFGTWRTNGTYYLRKMSQLYLELRNYAIDYGYKPESGMQFKYMVDMSQNVARNHGYSITVKQSSSFSSLKSKINENRAGAISVNGSSTFGNHAMGLYGYVEYQYKSGWWIFSSTKTAFFYVVDDGHSYKRNDSKYSYTSGGVTYPVSYYDPNTSAKPSISFTYLA